jgi:RHS repeat-associated protein
MKKLEKFITEKKMIKASTLIGLLLLAFFWFAPQVAHADLTGYCGWPIDPNQPPEEEEKEICKKCSGGCQKSPCSVDKGNYFTSAVDLLIPTRGFPLTLKREYASDRGIDGFFGYGWTSNVTTRLVYNTYLFAAPSTYLKMAAIVMPNGGVYKFTESPDGSFTPPLGIFDKLIKNGDGSFDLTPELSRNKLHFNAQGSLTAMTDAYNNTLSFTYDGGTGRLTQVSDATGSGRWMSFSYNPTGQIELIQDHSGRQVQYQYTSGKLMRVIDPASRNTDYAYVDGRFAPLLSQIKDHWGRVITDVTYDSADRVSSYSDAGEVWTYTHNYEGNSHRTAKTDSSGNIWEYNFNDDGQVVQTDPPPGTGSASSWAGYWPNRLLQYTVDETGVQTIYTYNSNGSIAFITRDDVGPNWVRFDYSYDPNFPEKVTSIIAKNPSTGQLDLNWQGQKFDYYQAGSTAPGALFHIYRVRNDGTTLDTLATFTYNTAGQILTATSATGGITTYGYNSTTGDLTSITYPKNSVSGTNPTYTYGRDSLGRIYTVTNALGKVTNFTYDNLNRVLTITLPKPQPTSPNFVTTYTYDTYDSQFGLVLTQETDPNGKITKAGHDQFGQIISITNSLGAISTAAYNKGLLASITDPNGNTTNYNYDSLRQLTSTSFPDGLTEIYTYWEDGLLKTRTDRKNQMISYNYDHMKRLIQKTYPNTTTIMFTYVGQKLTTVTDSFANETHSYSYDTSYRVSSDTQGTRGTVSYTYDAADRIATYSVSGGPTSTYTYYDDGSLKTIVWSPITGQFTYNYTLNGQYSSIVFPNNQQRNYLFDDQGRLTQLVNTHPTPGNLATYNYGYDINYAGGAETMLGLRTSMNATVPSQSFNNHQTKYYFENKYRLIKSEYPNVTPFNAEVDQWSYDLIDNRLTNTVNGVPLNYTYYLNPGNSNNGQRLQSDGVNSYNYDENGNQTTKSGPGGNITYNWDYQNRLSAITGAVTANYTYDYRGRRTGKNVGGLTTYIYVGPHVIAERGTNVSDYLFGPGIDEPLAMRRSGNTYYYDIDGVGSVTLLNNSSGSVQNKYVYDVWGQVRSQTTAISNPFGYTSREFAEAGSYYYRSRSYDPSLGRFSSEDIFRFSSGPNFFNYVNGNPVNFNDPFGYWTGHVGASAAGGRGIGVTVGLSVVFDGHGNVGLAFSAGYGGLYGSGVGAGGVVGGTTADNINQTSGWTNYAGGSFGPPAGLTVGAEGAWVKGPNGYVGENFSLGKSAGTAAEAHWFKEHTWIIPLFNVGVVMEHVIDTYFIGEPHVETEEEYYLFPPEDYQTPFEEEEEETRNGFCPGQ